MPPIRVIFYRENDGTVPVLDWFDTLERRAKVKCQLKIQRLEELGYELRRPEADYLGDGIYELRVRLQRSNYRILYFFHGNVAAVISHGLVKEKVVPPPDIDKAIARMRKYQQDPQKHTYREL